MWQDVAASPRHNRKMFSQSIGAQQREESYMVRRLSAFFACMFVLAGIATAQANGKLQIHHIDVGQGDGAVLISPGGQVVVFDAGEDMKRHDCTRPVSYL